MKIYLRLQLACLNDQRMYFLRRFRPTGPAFFLVSVSSMLTLAWIFVFFCDKLLCWFLSDNVHFQQAAEISEALVEEQVDFEAMVSRREIKRLCLSQGWLRINFVCLFSPPFYSGTPIRITVSPAQPINTSTPTWLTSCRGALGRRMCRGFSFCGGLQLFLLTYQEETDWASLSIPRLKDHLENKLCRVLYEICILFFTFNETTTTM